MAKRTYSRVSAVRAVRNMRDHFLQAKNDVADGWLKAAGKSLEELQEQIDASSNRRRSSWAEVRRRL